MYLRHLAAHLRTYIEHYPTCQLHQTKHHKPYSNMIPIDRPAMPFHTVIMDFIMSLPLQAGVNCLLTITYKFSKRVLLILGKTTWTAVE